MNDYQKQLVQKSFQQIVPIADQAAQIFYDRLFTLDPALRPLFKGDMTQQGLKLMNTLRFAVTGLDAPDTIISALQSLGRSHVQYGVEDAHYETVGDALIWTLSQGLGDAFTDEVRQAWLETYSLLSSVMREAAKGESIMDAFENARKFFEACEEPLGWAGCQQYVADGATFMAQSEPLAEIDTVQAYCDWMHGFGTVTSPEGTYELHTASYDEAARTAIFFATYHGKHTGDGGPVPATQQETHSHYVYVLTMNEDAKVTHMVKIWNAPWAMRELGWIK